MPSLTQRSGDQGAGTPGSAKKSAKKSRPDKYYYYALNFLSYALTQTTI